MEKERIYKILMATGIPALDTGIKDLEKCEITGICKNRNEDIVNKINSLAKYGKKQIVAIGYNHYFGSDSVKTLLEKDGYEITEY